MVVAGMMEPCVPRGCRQFLERGVGLAVSLALSSLSLQRLLMPSFATPSFPGPGCKLLLVVALGIASAAAIAQERSTVPELPDRGTVASARGCEVGYHLRRPPDAVEGVVAIVAHGFLRTGAFMSGWGEAIAAAGVASVTVDLCLSGTGDNRRADDGADLVAVRRALGYREAIYVGVSAGGLAALVAASLDAEGSRGLLLLDPVNAGGQARSAAGRVRVPAAALVAKPQVCNAWRNIDPALESLADVTRIAVGKASHCDFEWPTDRFCRIACVAHNSDDEREQAQARIRRVGVDFVRAVAAASPQALADWRGGIGPD